MANKQPMPASTKNTIIVCATIVLCLIIGVTVFLVTSMERDSEEPVISVFLTMNPVIRIDLNQAGTILNIIPHDEAAQAVVAGFSVGNRGLGEVVSDLSSRAANLGLVSEEGSISLSIYAPDEAAYRQTNEELNQIRAELGERHSVTVAVERISEPLPVDTRPANTPRP